MTQAGTRKIWLWLCIGLSVLLVVLVVLAVALGLAERPGQAEQAPAEPEQTTPTTLP